jgi:hypothetical protein
MPEVPLARMWQLPDGTTCLLLKDPSAEHWELRVTRQLQTLRSERFGNPIVAMEEARHWRSTYDPSFQRAR